MAVKNASNLILKVSPSVGGTEQRIMHCKSCNLTLSSDTIDITTKYNSGWKNSLASMKSWTVSGDGMMDFNSTDTDTEFDELFTQFDAQVPVTLTFTLESPETGEYYFSGSGFITSMEISGGTEDSPNYSFSIDGNGPLTKTDQV